jgi:hypothetical protein
MKNRLKNFVIFLIFIVPLVSLYSQGIPDDSLYLGQTPPGMTPEKFAPGIISLSNRDESVITFSPDGKQVFFSINQYPNRRAMFMEYKNGKWTNPEMASFSTTRSIDEPSFSLDGNRVYYNTNIAPNLVGGFDVSYSEKQDSVWSDAAISLGSPLNSGQDDYHPCIVAESSIYFTGSSGEICRSQYLNGVYLSRIILPYPINYANTSQAWGDPYVSPDESYMIFQSSRSGGYGANDLYISYIKTNGSWTNPKNLGSEINTSGNDSDGDITSDGKYMTFNREWRDIYWVSSSFIDSLRHTNFIPYVKRTIPNQTAVKDSLFNYQIPDSTFIDDDGNSTLGYTATLSNGTPLPVWLSFDSVTCVLSGIPDTAVQYNMKVTATDAAGASVSSAVFRITVTNPPAGIKEEEGQVSQGFTLDQNYPNPFNPSTTIHYSLTKSSFVKLNIYNLLGQHVRTLQNAFQIAGEHSLVWDARDEKNNSVCSGVYFYHLEAGSLNLRKKMILLK